jgi:DNA replication protein DnaC
MALNKSKNFVEDFPNTKGLLLTGPVGTGKTHLACAIANELLERLYSVYFGNVVDIMSFIKSTYSKNSEIAEDEAINLMTDKVDLFIIDDLGKQNETSYTSSMLYQLINRVYENKKPIIITTNENSTELAGKLGDRGQATVSRITQMCEPVVFKGEDWRLKR